MLQMHLLTKKKNHINDMHIYANEVMWPSKNYFEFEAWPKVHVYQNSLMSHNFNFSAFLQPPGSERVKYSSLFLASDRVTSSYWGLVASVWCFSVTSWLHLCSLFLKSFYCIVTNFYWLTALLTMLTKYWWPVSWLGQPVLLLKYTVSSEYFFSGK